MVADRAASSRARGYSPGGSHVDALMGCSHVASLKALVFRLLVSRFLLYTMTLHQDRMLNSPIDGLQGSYLDSGGDLFSAGPSSRVLSTPRLGSMPPIHPYDAPYQQADMATSRSELQQRIRQLMAMESGIGNHEQATPPSWVRLYCSQNVHCHYHNEQGSRAESVLSDASQASVDARIRHLEEVNAEQSRNILALM